MFRRGFNGFRLRHLFTAPFTVLDFDLHKKLALEACGWFWRGHLFIAESRLSQQIRHILIGTEFFFPRLFTNAPNGIRSDSRARGNSKSDLHGM